MALRYKTSMAYESEKRILPPFPRTPSMFRRDNDDIVAFEELDLFQTERFIVEEKLDGANCGIALSEGNDFIIRNRKHILKKGYKKNTKAKPTPKCSQDSW
jgi:ATP-dependent RNA circularization protein (DNA/RNA ligase family)